MDFRRSLPVGLKTHLKKLWRQPAPQPSLPPEPSADNLAAQFPDIPHDQIITYLAVKPYTMTSPERTFGLCQAVEHVVRNRIPGALVECGVWRGGSAMAMLQVLQRLQAADRHLWLYDTYEGMSPPGREDVDCYGNSAEQLLERDQAKRQAADSVWCEASLADVQQNIATVPYPSTQLHFIQGKVEQTLPQSAPEQIALLRLDTDWFESTWHELVHLYPRLQPGGILIIDDYGHWQGCRQAVDQFIEQRAPGLFLHRLDYTGRLAIKPHA
jgi:O-methyltransferase